MNKAKHFIITLITLLSLFQTEALSQTRKRSEVSVEETWNPQDIYASDEMWSEAKLKLSEQFDQVLRYKGKLATSSSQLLSCLDFHSRLAKELDRLQSYAAMISDEDTRNSKYLAMRQDVEQLITDYSSKASFIEPEIAKMDKQTIDRFLKKEPGLEIYKTYLYDIQRTKAHRLSEQ